MAEGLVKTLMKNWACKAVKSPNPADFDTKCPDLSDVFLLAGALSTLHVEAGVVLLLVMLFSSLLVA